MEKIQVAVIGCGSIANSAHGPSYAKIPEAHIAYCVDIIPERAQKFKEKFGDEETVALTDYREMLRDPRVQAVSVCVPNYLHNPISIDCLRAGKNVLCEKPASVRYDLAQQMADAAHETGRILNIGVVNRFNDSVNRIKRYIDSGKLGDVFHVYVSFRACRSIPGLGGAFTTKAIAGGGVLIDWGVHYLDIVMYCCGDPKPRSVTGEAFCKLGKDMKDYVYESMWAEDTKNLEGTYDVDDSITGMIRTEGPVITFNGAWAQNIGESETYIDFMGDKGGVRLTYGGGYTFFGTKDGKLISETPEIEKGDMFLSELQAFVDCVRTGEHIRSYVDNNLITARMMQGLYDSDKAGKEVSF